MRLASAKPLVVFCTVLALSPAGRRAPREVGAERGRITYVEGDIGYRRAGSAAGDPIPPLIGQVDIDRLDLVATDLVTRFGPRHPSASRPFIDDKCTYSSTQYPKHNLDMAADYVESAFKAMGYDVEREAIKLAGGYTGHNVIATSRGTVDPATFIEMGAHIDTVATTPGAGDNASGATALVEIARVLREYPSRYSFRYIAHVGEEHGQTGSNQHLDGVVSRDERVKAGLLMDGIGWSEIAPRHMNCIWPNDDPESRRIAELYDTVRRDYSIDIGWRVCAPDGQTADNVPYWHRGIPAILSIGGLPYTAPGYHGCGDTMDKVDLVNVLLTAQQNLAVLLRLDAEAVPTWRQSDWSGGAGQGIWVDEARYDSSVGIEVAVPGVLTLAEASHGELLFADQFTRPPDAAEPLAPWIIKEGVFEIADGVLGNVVPPTGYAVAYIDEEWTDYRVAANIRIPGDGFAACMSGRVDAATGAQYSACVYADNRLVLIDLRDWDMRWEPIAEVALAEVGDGWHRLEMEFSKTLVRVYYEGQLTIERRSDLYSEGGIGLFTWTGSVPESGNGAQFDEVVVRGPREYSDRGTLRSSAFDGGVGVDWGALTWKGSVFDATAIRLRTRSSDSIAGLATGAWSGWSSSTGSPVSSPDARWIQYEVELTSTADTASPRLEEVALSFDPAEPRSNLVYLPRVSW